MAKTIDEKIAKENKENISLVKRLILEEIKSNENLSPDALYNAVIPKYFDITNGERNCGEYYDLAFQDKSKPIIPSKYRLFC